MKKPHASNKPSGRVRTIRLADTLIDVAAEVERDEESLKKKILDAAVQGDLSLVIRIVRLWLGAPPSDVCAAFAAKQRRGGVDS